MCSPNKRDGEDSSKRINKLAVPNNRVGRKLWKIEFNFFRKILEIDNANVCIYSYTQLILKIEG